MTKILLGFIVCLIMTSGLLCFAQEKKTKSVDPVPAANLSLVEPYQDVGPMTKQTTGSSIVSLVKIIISLVIIVVFIYLTVYVLKIISGQSSPADATSLGNLELIDTLYLSPGKSVQMVYAGKDILLIACADKQVTFLSKIDDPLTVQSILKKRQEKFESAKPFGDYLRLAQKKQVLKSHLLGYLGSVKNMLKGKKDL